MPHTPPTIESAIDAIADKVAVLRAFVRRRAGVRANAETLERCQCCAGIGLVAPAEMKRWTRRELEVPDG